MFEKINFNIRNQKEFQPLIISYNQEIKLKQCYKNRTILQNILNPIQEETIKQFVKVKVSQLPSDLEMKQYYESVFSKSTNDSHRKKWHRQDKNLLIWCMTKHLMSQNRSNLIPNVSIRNQSNQNRYLCFSPIQNLTLDKRRRQNFDRYCQLILFKEQLDRINYQVQLIIFFLEISQINKRKMEQCFKSKYQEIQNEMNGRSENQIKNQYNGIIRNLKRFNVQESDEKSLLKTIVDNPHQKLSLKITKFMSDFLVKQQANANYLTQIKKIKHT